MKQFLRFLAVTLLVLGFSTGYSSAEGVEFSQKVYKVGMDHKDVALLQGALKKDGAFTLNKTTTYFGNITKKSVKTFQNKYGLKVDGMVGKATINKMIELGLVAEDIKPVSRGSGQRNATYVFSQRVYKKSMEYNDIKIIQEGLKKDGVLNLNKTTRYFGQMTEKAVKKFQQKHGLKVDGVVGKGTLNKMIDLDLINGTVQQVTSRGSSKRKVGQYLDWWSQVSNKIVRRGDILTIEDLNTGKTFKVKVTAGTNHADTEAVTKEDTARMKAVWGGFSWSRRPVLVYKDNKVIAASMTNMPHAGLESKPAGKTVSNRSGGFGRGYNYDFVKGNGMDGHVDLHFKNSKRHKDNKKDPKHQSAIKKAAGLK